MSDVLLLLNLVNNRRFYEKINVLFALCRFADCICAVWRSRRRNSRRLVLFAHNYNSRVQFFHHRLVVCGYTAELQKAKTSSVASGLSGPIVVRFRLAFRIGMRGFSFGRFLVLYEHDYRNHSQRISKRGKTRRSPRSILRGVFGVTKANQESEDV